MSGEFWNNCTVHGAWCREDCPDTAPCPWCEISRLKLPPARYRDGTVAEVGDIVSFAFDEAEVWAIDGSRVRLRFPPGPEGTGMENKQQADRCVLLRRKGSSVSAPKNEPETTPRDALRARVIDRVGAWLDDAFAKSDAHVDDIIGRKFESDGRPVAKITISVVAPAVIRDAGRHQAAFDLLVAFKERGFIK